MQLKTLLAGIPSTVSGELKKNITDIVYDTRKELKPTYLFVCIVGFSFDGHDCIMDAYQRGIRVFAVQKEVSLPEDATIVTVKDTRKFLALASANLFGHPDQDLLTIAITGTKGKTSTSFMIQSILNEAGIPTGVIGSTGIYYGDIFEETSNTTPESYLIHQSYRKMLDAGCKAVVIEAASQGFKLHRTHGIFFDAGVFTNISPDHIGKNEHADFAEYLQCKKMLFSQSKHVYVNGNDPHYEEIVDGVKAPYSTYTVETPSSFFAKNPVFYLKDHQLMTSFTAVCNQEEFPVELGVPGYFSLYNAMAAISLTRDLGISVDAIQKGLKKVHVRGRMEIVPLDKPFTVIIDAAHEEFSTRSLLDTIRMYKPSRIITVFGCGGNRSPLRRPGMGKAVGELSDYAIITSDNSRMEKTEDIIQDILGGMVPTGGKYEIIIQRKEAIKKALRMAREGDVILLIGKGHETYEDIGGKKTPFSERQIVLDYVAAGMPEDN